MRPSPNRPLVWVLALLAAGIYVGGFAFVSMISLWLAGPVGSVSLVVGVLGAVVGALMGWRMPSVAVRTGGVVALAGSLGIAGLLTPAVVEMREHDRLHAEFVERVCTREFADEVTIEHCAGEVQNESQGNRCEYAVVFIAASEAWNAEELANYFSSRALVGTGPVYVDELASHRIRATALSFHDTSDFRCL